MKEIITNLKEVISLKHEYQKIRKNSLNFSLETGIETYVSMYNKEDGNAVEINHDPLDEAGADKYSGLGAYETVDNYADGENHDASIEEMCFLPTTLDLIILTFSTKNFGSEFADPKGESFSISS